MAVSLNKKCNIFGQILPWEIWLVSVSSRETVCGESWFRLYYYLFALLCILSSFHIGYFAVNFEVTKNSNLDYLLCKSNLHPKMHGVLLWFFALYSKYL